MIRNLKTLGLALVAILAMSAFAASTASAGVTTGKITSDGDFTITGEKTGVGDANALTAYGSSVTCNVSTYSGHRTLTEHETSTGVKHGFLLSGATEVTVTPHYTECTKHVIMNGCDYVIRDATTTGGVNGTYGVTADLECPTGKTVTVDDTSIFNCDSHFGTQTGLIGAPLTDTGNGHLDLTGTIEGIKATNNCFGETTTAKLDIDATIKAHNTALGSTNISLSH
jgi:hypothetical protein